MASDSRLSPAADAQDSSLSFDEVAFLLDAVHDLALEVRTGALRALVRLPLNKEVWGHIAHILHAEFAFESTTPRREIVEAAVYVPAIYIRQRVRELAEQGTEEEQRIAAYALTRARDAAAIPRLVADLSEPDLALRVQAAENLSLLDVTPVKDAVRRVCLEDASLDVRFWLALALARLGEAEGIESLLLDLDAGSTDFDFLWGDYSTPLSAIVAGRGPFPDVVNDLLQRMASDERLSDCVRQIADELFCASVHAPAKTSDVRDASSATTEPVDEPDLIRQATELAEEYVAGFLDEEWAGVSWEEVQLLAHLPTNEATELISNLFAYAMRLPSDYRAGRGNYIMNLPSDMWRKFVPDIPVLFETYVALGESDRELRAQLTWTMSRAGIRCLLAESALRWADAQETERVAIVHLIEKAILYSRYDSGPLFGGGGEPADVSPTAEPFINELEWGTKGIDLAPPELYVEPPVSPVLSAEIPDSPEVEKLEPRWLQGQLFEIDGEEKRIERALRAGARHRLVVRIGVADEEWITAPQDAALPIEDLPADQVEYALRVVFWEPNHVPESLSDMIYLRREGGNSTTCEFQFCARRDVPEFKGRVVVYYENRILQILSLVAQVLPDPAHALPEASIYFYKEPIQVGLKKENPFDVMVVADTEGDRGPRVVEISDQRKLLHELENVKQFNTRILHRLSRVADAPDDYGDLDGDDTTELLRFLARQGNLLYKAMRDQIGEDSPLLDSDCKRIQLVSAVDSILPLELMYERQPPWKPDAKLCEHAKEALEKGECNQCDENDTEFAAANICPLGFWCMGRVIERHTIRPCERSDLKGADYALQRDTTVGGDLLSVLDAAVFAASEHVRKEQSNGLWQTLVKLTRRQEYARDWDTLCTAVHNCVPSILMLLPHTVQDDDYILNLEIGKDCRLPVDGITQTLGYAVQGHWPSVVVLLGCKTAAPDLPFQGFVPEFRRNGVALVLTTLTPVLGRHAAPVAEMLLNEFEGAAEETVTFGDVLLRVRRRALAAGIPMVLSLVAYGDADWRVCHAASQG
jgi:hypothetical protein